MTCVGTGAGAEATLQGKGKFCFPSITKGGIRQKQATEDFQERGALTQLRAQTQANGSLLSASNTQSAETPTTWQPCTTDT